MSLFHGDIVIKTAIELALEDMRKNPWLIIDCFSSLIENPLLKEKYGIAEAHRAKEFILNNNIPVYLKGRIDKQEFPCVTIAIGPSDESDELATLGDLSTEIETLYPENINQPIKYIIPPFNIISYDKETGIIEIPTDVQDYRYISEGMVAVDPSTGNGLIILDKGGENGFKVAVGSTLPSGTLGIVPQYQMYRARRERAISKETYNIGCHSQGDPSTLIFLFSVVKYGLFRYRESLLEHENFQLSSLSATDMIKNDAFDVENVYSRFIVLRGQVEEYWIKAPKRVIESIDFSENIGTSSDPVLEFGIKILSQAAPEEYAGDDELWVTVDGGDDNDE
jgi:hypothetical protein